MKNKNKYAFEIIDDAEDVTVCFDFNRYNTLRSEGWRIRRIHNKKILENLEALIQHIQRLC